MKKILAFLAFAAAMNVSAVKAYPPPQLLDDSASFRIAKSVKLGYGDASAPSVNKGTKKAEFNTCSSDSQCQAAQKCENGKCVPVCTSTTCSGETPDCKVKDHTATCECTETSCGTGKQCVDGKCEACATGTRCNCSGEKVIDTAGKCVCPSSVSCSAGQYVSDDCSCKSCQESSGDKCGCPGNTVPDGSGGCYCKTKKSCGEGFSFDSTNTCECVPCADNNSCENPCPEGSFPNGSGCGTYVCVTDENCAAGNRCENGGTESAQCVPCGKNEQCRCPDGQLSDGSGNCVPVACKTGLVCSDSVTSQCCDAGMQCVNPDTVESYCAACEVDTQCTCPAGYVVNSAGKCVKPDCTKDSDCSNGNKCDNAGKSTAACTPCDEGETCTCTGGMIADGNGGCKFGCEFSSAAECKAGTKNCSNCTLSAGCYVCTGCGDGYQIDGSSCSPKACPTGYATDVPCDTSNGYTLETNGKSGDKTCGRCVAASCPSGYSTDTTSCGNGYTFETSGYSAGKACGRCVVTACPDGYSTTKTSCTRYNEKLETSGSSAGKACGKCVLKTCAEIDSSYKTSCPADAKASNVATGSDGDCYTCKLCSNSQCPDYQKCVDGECTPACINLPSGFCSSSTPDLVAYNHTCGCACNDSSCPTGQYCDNSSPLRKCVAASCPDGYSTDVTSCTNTRGSNYVLLTNGYSNGKACGKCGCPEGQIDNGRKCVPNKTCAELGKEQGETWIGDTGTCPTGSSDIATGEIGKDGVCQNCIYRFDPISPVSSCGSTQITCTFDGIQACCPKNANGCSAYVNDCKSVGNGLYTGCRCIVTNTSTLLN